MNKVATAGLYKTTSGNHIVILHQQGTFTPNKDLTHVFSFSVKGLLSKMRSIVLAEIKKMAKNRKIKIAKISEA